MGCPGCWTLPACSSLLRRRLRTGAVTLSSSDPVSIKDRALLFLAAPARRNLCSALWCGLVVPDRVQASSGALGMLVCVWSASLALAL